MAVLVTVLEASFNGSSVGRGPMRLELSFMKH
jgi:hypothetical protein